MKSIFVSLSDSSYNFNTTTIGTVETITFDGLKDAKIAFIEIGSGQNTDGSTSSGAVLQTTTLVFVKSPDRTGNTQGFSIYINSEYSASGAVHVNFKTGVISYKINGIKGWTSCCIKKIYCLQ